MAEQAKNGEWFVQVGVTAMRDPGTGEFLPARPLYIKVDEQEIDRSTGLSAGENVALQDVARIFADKFKQYHEGIQETKERGVKGE